jgi:hypothetical protein
MQHTHRDFGAMSCVLGSPSRARPVLPPAGLSARAPRPMGGGAFIGPDHATLGTAAQTAPWAGTWAEQEAIR